MNADRRKALRYGIEVRALSRENERLKDNLMRSRCSEDRLVRQRRGLEKMRKAMYEIQDILKVGRTYTGAVRAVKELVQTMGVEIK